MSENLFDQQIIEKGASDYFCPSRTIAGNCRCTPVCKRCGWGVHMAIHGPVFGKEPGSEPFGHEFIEGEKSLPPAYKLQQNYWRDRQRESRKRRSNV